MSRRPSAGLLIACLFLSGATALVYEVVWLRMLGLVFGHTVHAVTTILAAFMGGLGLGSYVFGRRAAGLSDPIRAYGFLEIGIGVSCALTPALFWLAARAYPGLHATLTTSYTAFSLVQFGLVFVILLVPTALMGATLPVLVQGLARDEVEVPRTVGTLYAMNTAGAVLGVALAGYVLLPEWGNRAVLWTAAVANVAIGLVVIGYGSRHQSVRERRATAAGNGRRETSEADAPSGRLEARLIAAALVISGAVSMVYEVAWTRALALVIGSSTYAFSAMLLAFLIGIAGGAAAYSRFWGGARAGPVAFATIQGGIGLTVALVMLVFERMPEVVLMALQHSVSPVFVQAVQVMVSSLALLGPALLIGATFPCAVAAWASTTARAGADTGRLYALNTLGAIAGTVLTGFLLVSTIGVHASITAGIVTNLGLAACLFAIPLRAVSAWRWGAVAVALVAAAVVPFLPRWNPQVMTSGVAIYALEYLPDVMGGAGAPWRDRREIVFYRDGPTATVAVTRAGDRVSLRVNGKVDASNNLADMPTQFMLGHLPLLLHPDPREVLVIGLGSGITTGAVARHPVRHLDIVEIEPAVVEASKFFVRENGNVLGDPRTRLLVADGRNFLLTTPNRYDVIASAPSNPWIGGLASLFSREFFGLARQRLRPGGLMVQWIQGYGLAPRDLAMVVATFQSVFPATSVWQVAQGDYLLVGRPELAPLDLRSIKERWEAIKGLREDLGLIGIEDWPGVLGFFLLGEADVARLSVDKPLNTDDRLELEFSAPLGLLVDTAALNYRMLQSARTSTRPALTPESAGEIERPAAQYAMGLVPFAQRRWTDSLIWFRRALELDPDYTPAALKAAQASLHIGRPSDALAFAQRVLAKEPQHPEALGIAAGVRNRQ